MPYQDAIAVVLHVHDFHMEMIAKEPKERYFHEKQANRLRNWLIDQKEYIHTKEAHG
tara:strand:- start:14657 stop:14827 length:171 start_codon:yes stop_codon:yes gene_type:complete